MKGCYFISILELIQHTKMEVYISYCIHIAVNVFKVYCRGNRRDYPPPYQRRADITQTPFPHKKRETLQRKPASHSSQFSYLAPYSTPGCPACH